MEIKSFTKQRYLNYTCFDFCQREDRQIIDGRCFCMNIRIPAILLK